MATEPPPAKSSGFGVWFGRVAAVLGAIVIALYYFSPTQELTNATLDYSNYVSYAYFTGKGFQYGQQVLPIVGPLGFVMYGYIYGGSLFWDHLYLDLLIKFGLAALLLWFFCRSRPALIRWPWFAVALLVGVTPMIGDSAYDFAILFGGLFLLVNPNDTRRLQLAELAVAAFLALLALLKGTQLMLSLLALGFLAGAMRDRRRLAWIAGTYLAAFLLFWKLAGQSLLNIPGFLRGIEELSAGYNDAMSIQEPLATAVTGMSVVSLLLLAIAGAWFVRRQHRPVGFALLFLSGFTFVSWKHGFVRADGHVTIFFHYACAIAMTALLLLNFADATKSARTRREVTVRWVVHGVATLALIGGLVGAGWESLHYEFSRLPGLVPAHVEHLLTVRAQKKRLDQDLGIERDQFALPGVAEMVGTSSIDFFGSGHGFLTLNRLNYQPRPMGGGSFSVYTPYLEQRNEQHLRDPRTRPNYMLLNLETIDDRFLAQDDARSLVALIEGYEPVEAEQGMLLLRARPGAVPAGPRLLGERSFVFGENVPVPMAQPGEIVLASFELPLNLAGLARKFFYKAPVLHLQVEGAGIILPDHRRLVAGMVKLPIVLTPVLETTSDMLDLYSADPGKIVRHFRIDAAAPGCYARDQLRVRFEAVPRPSPLAAADLAELRDRLRYPVANTLPALVEPASDPARSIGAYLQLLHPPGRIVFPLRGDERELFFSYGIDPEAYGRGQTDGVEFTVEVCQPGQAPQLLFRRLLRPRTVPDDRGNQNQRVVLMPFVAGSTLTIRTGIGPENNGGWDWAYLLRIRFKRGPFIAEQFPGFNVVPVRVDSSSAGALGQDTGPVFLLPAPSALQFALTGSEHSLRLEGGLLPGAYTNGGRSDGAEFIVEFQRRDGSVEPIFRRYLNPREVTAERGTQHFTLSLPAHAAGTVLIVRTAAGPAGSNAWDWTYLSKLDLE